MYYNDFFDIYDPDQDFSYMRQQPRPPFGPPPGAPFGPPFGRPPGAPPFGGGPGTQRPPVGRPPVGGPPTGRPPAFVPQQQQQQQGPSIYAVDPGAIRPCTYQYVYLWLRDGRSFWAYLTFVGPRSVAGFRWARFRWVYFGTDLRNIDNFTCY